MLLVGMHNLFNSHISVSWKSSLAFIGQKREIKQQAGDEKHHALQYIMYRDQNDDKKDIISHECHVKN